MARDPQEPGPPTTCICFLAGGGSVCLLVFGDHNSGSGGSQHLTWRWGKNSNVSRREKRERKWEVRAEGKVWPWGLR